MGEVTPSGEPRPRRQVAAGAGRTAGAATSVVLDALIYFAWVFAAGFAFGLVRVPVLVPRLGERMAELLEMPVMLLVIVWVSRWRQRRSQDPRPGRQLAVGALALLLMLAAECALGLLQGRTPIAVLLARDPVSGSAYYAALLVFAALPWWWARRAARARRSV